ncbi:pyridoxamine 5'-phosphate oxidase family protein [uncultured Roseobacter sp.]|uniref:pyridoxamine 5'-phosphate oxidase family protein n=1 Tax=uncultured Roseobacter sp. TaxID=114847 RepID=UPI00260A4EA4|nr:pyridoxamine 5'-phosphate oxidase family protein [uncultured Roseobacter sp.]
MKNNDQIGLSPFHAGELAAQDRAGKRDRMAVIGRRAIRPFMPDQHRTFFEQLPFVVMGSVDEKGQPWASVVSGGTGFIRSPDDRHLGIMAKPHSGDPLAGALRLDAPVGVLGIEPSTRRRNRMNAHVTEMDAGWFTLRVDQSFGNCPQYIQTRDLRFVRPVDETAETTGSVLVTDLDDQMRSFIRSADTLFVASAVRQAANPAARGVDVSHRGGLPGFVKAEGNTITVPDYAGNNFFNTIGNFVVNPRAGLLFPDFETGDVLQLTGTVELLWSDDPEIARLENVDRAWRFTLDHGVRTTDALPFRANFGEYSPQSLGADTWEAAARRKLC